jgi:hypothetical protein
MAVERRRYSLPRPLAALPALLAETPALLPMLILVAAMLGLAADEAGFAQTSWYPAALLALALLVVTLFALGPPVGLPRALAAALLLFAAYTAWTYVSILWADRQGDALDGANRTLLYLVVLAVFAGWPVGPRGGRIVLAATGLGIALIGLVELVRVHSAADPIGFFLEGRLVEPAGYVNANVAIWTLGLLACLSLAAARDVPPALRSLALGGAGVLASLALLGQSRGWLLTLPPALVLLVALSPGRLRALGAVLAVAAMTAVVSGRLLAVHDDFSPARLDDLVADALAATLTSAVVLALVGAAAALLDRRSTPAPDAERRPPAARPRLRIALAVGAVAVVVAGLALGGGALSNAWEDFKEGGQPEAGSSRFTSVGTYRYDFWRVAWELFEENPVTGIGVENFQEDYLRRGDGFEQPRFAHSLELGVLSQTGLVGAALLFGALGCALWAGFARRRGPRGALAWVSAGALGMFSYWLLHASLDWLWEFPALGGIAFAALGLACAPAASKAAAPLRRLPAAGTAAVAVAAALLAVVLAFPWLAERETRRAVDGWRAAPAASFDRLDRAAALNPLSARPHTVAGTIAVELGQLGRAQAAFREVLAIEPENAYALLELGAIAAERGDRRRALTILRQARGLRPRDEAVRLVLARVLRRRPVSVSAVNQRILEQARGRVQRAP